MSPKNLFNLVLLAALWGASFMFMRVATPEFGPFALIEIRVLIASLFLLPIWYFREGKTSGANVLQNWRLIFIVGILNSAVPFVLFAYSTLYITGGYASVINATTPMWGAFVTWLWLGTKLNINSTIGLLLGVIGVAILVSGSISLSMSGISLGILSALSATLFYGIAANYVAIRLQAVSSLTLATFSMVAATIVLLPLAIIYYPDNQISIQAWLSLLAMAVFSTAFANILYFRLIADVGSTKAITVAFLIPIFGTLFGVIFINEQITIKMILGSIVILLGTALVTGVLSFKKDLKTNQTN